MNRRWIRTAAMLLGVLVLVLCLAQGRWVMASSAGVTLLVELWLLVRARIPLRIRTNARKPLRIGSGGG